MTQAILAEGAYAAASTPIRTERGTEYAAFQKITAALARASRSGAPMAERAAALHDNRRLWTTLATDLASADNALPQPLRAQLFFLAEYSLLQSRAALRDVAAITPLIDVHRSVMRGLAGSDIGSDAAP